MEHQTNHSGISAADGAHTLADSIQNASKGAHAVIDQVSDNARPAVERIAGEAHAIVDRLAGAAGSAGASIGLKGEQLGQAGRRVTSQARSYVGEHPLAAVGIALAAGFLVSRLIRKQ